MKTVSLAIGSKTKMDCVKGICWVLLLNDTFGTVVERGLKVATLTGCTALVSLCRSNYYHLPKAQTSLRAKNQSQGEKAGWEVDLLSQVYTLTC